MVFSLHEDNLSAGRYDVIVISVAECGSTDFPTICYDKTIGVYSRHALPSSTTILLEFAPLMMVFVIR
ncbi:MAG: hypothetical protein OXC46_10245 [Thaumarchaeota archaeon]|nr:hypothetical protein [Nitrososphaerota archaeon]